MIRGKQYVVDATRFRDGSLGTELCGSSGEIRPPEDGELEEYLKQREQSRGFGVSYSNTTEFLNYLRGLKENASSTYISVQVRERVFAVPDAEVTLVGPNGTLTGTTSSDGVANFEGLVPGQYHAGARKEFYETVPDRGPGSLTDVEIPISGACAQARVSLKAVTTVSGLVRSAQGAPVPSLILELQEIRNSPAAQDLPDTIVGRTTTAADGAFRFPSVSPGRYYLGTNLLTYMTTSQIGRTYYPSQRTKDGAVPIEVQFGENTGNLVLTLPDFGPQRNIRICVVDPSGQPVAEAQVKDGFERGMDRQNVGTLGETTTDASGCVVVQGVERVEYVASAILRKPGNPISNMFTDSVHIPPGEGPVEKLLVLKVPPVGTGPKQ